MLSAETKKEIIKIYEILDYNWHGKLDQPSFFNRISHLIDLEKLPSNDPRYTNMSGDLYQHTVNNESDWEENWVFNDNRLKLESSEDEIFKGFVIQTIDPSVIDSVEKCAKLVFEINKILKANNENIELRISNQIGDKYVYEFIEIYKLSNEYKFKIYIYHVLNPHPTKINFTTRGYSDQSLVLVADNWDDNFDYKTSFTLYYYINISSYVKIGEVKILDFENNINRLISNLVTDSTNNNYYSGKYTLSPLIFASLGCSADYYFNINKYFGEKSKEVLSALADISLDTNRQIKLQKSKSGYDKSLLRHHKIDYLDTVSKIIENTKLDNFFPEIDFENLEIKQILHCNSIPFNLKYRESLIPSRLHVLIGENGTGKTQILHQITKHFNGNIGSFTKVLFISYSKFDPSIVQENPNIMIVNLSDKSQDYLINDIFNKLKKILDLGRFPDWKVIISKSFPEIDFNDVYRYLLDDTKENLENFVKPLSSGQTILLFLFTNIFEFIRDKTIIIIDEPETHLHPSIIFRFIQSFNTLLETYNSFALIATHSPIFLQGITSENVSVLKSQGEGMVQLEELNFECFGASFDEINSRVFGIEDNLSYFKQILIDLKNDDFEKDEIIDSFSKHLSLSTRIFLENIYDQS